eukprot:PhM_4_TR1747/c0_g1_i2/m.42005/K14829/IPI3; pre-rRNA-processing protein IPI3
MLVVFNSTRNCAVTLNTTGNTMSQQFQLGERSSAVACAYSPVHHAFFVAHRTPPSIRVHRHTLVSAGKPHQLTCACPEVVATMVLSNNEEYLLAGGESGAVYTWHIRSGLLLRAFPAHFDAVQSISVGLGVSADAWLATASKDASVKVWNVCDMYTLEGATAHAEPLQSIHSHTVDVRHVVTFPSNPTIVATTSGDSSVRMFDVVLGQEIFTTNLPSPAECVALAPWDEGTLYVGCEDGTIASVAFYHPTHSDNDSGSSKAAPSSQSHTAMQRMHMVTGSPCHMFFGTPEEDTIRPTLGVVVREGKCIIIDVDRHQVTQTIAFPFPVSCACSVTQVQLDVGAHATATNIGHLRRFPLTQQSEDSLVVPLLPAAAKELERAHQAHKQAQAEKKQRAKQNKKNAKRGNAAMQHQAQDTAAAATTTDEFAPLEIIGIAQAEDDSAQMALRAEADHLRAEIYKLSELSKELIKRRKL